MLWPCIIRGHLLQPKHCASAVWMKTSACLSFALNWGLNFVGRSLQACLWHHKNNGTWDHQNCISIGPWSWGGFKQSVFWDSNQSVTGDRWKCGWPVREGLHYRNADRRWTEVNHQCVRERQTLRANLWPVICVIIYVIILLMVD